MDYSIIIRPLIGAGIGYITNWIAVKMMFRPLKPIKIGKITLPFTPGIIPKNQPRLAEAIGNTVANSLLTEDDLKKVLLSDDVKKYITSTFNNYLISQNENKEPIKKIICNYIEEENFNTSLNKIEANISTSIYTTVLEANLGTLISSQIEIAAKEKLKGSMLGFLGGNSIVSSFIPAINDKLDEYIKNNGQTLIQEMVKKELNKYTEKPLGNYSLAISQIDFNFEKIIISIYEKLINDKISELLNTINISKIVTEKINNMDVLELEKILLQIMKKELNALVNLGAIIGFILGLLNLLI